MWFIRRRDRADSKAEEALKGAEENLQDVKKRGKEISEISEAFRELRERNHFAEQLEQLIVRRRGGYSR